MHVFDALEAHPCGDRFVRFSLNGPVLRRLEVGAVRQLGFIVKNVLTDRSLKLKASVLFYRMARSES